MGGGGKKRQQASKNSLLQRTFQYLQICLMGNSRGEHTRNETSTLAMASAQHFFSAFSICFTSELISVQ